MVQKWVFGLRNGTTEETMWQRSPKNDTTAPRINRKRYGKLFFWAMSLGVLLSASVAQAQTWTGSGGNNNWSTAGNWQNDVVPNSAAANAVLSGNSTANLLRLDSDITLASLVFQPAANGTARAFTITDIGADNLPHNNALNIGAGGIANNTNLTQTINAVVALQANTTFSSIAGGTLSFLGTAANRYNQVYLNGYNLTVSGTGNTSIASPINGSGNLVKTGTGTLTLGGIGSNFSGSLAINQGTLIADAGQTVYNPATSVLGSTITANRTITVGNGTNAATLQFGASQVFGTGNSSPQVGLVVNKGSTINNNGGQFNILPNLTLNGGTLTGTGGLSASQQMYAFAFGSVLVRGSQMSTISGSGPNSGYHLGGSTTFDVANAIDNGTALLVSGNLVDNFGGNGAGALVKTGEGTMVLTGNNTYSGGTTINGGYLYVGDNTHSSSLGTGNVTVKNGGILDFNGSSSAGNATITSASTLRFGGSSSAGSATITNSGFLSFYSSSSMGSAAIINNNDLEVDSSSSTGNSTITNNGRIVFRFSSATGNTTITNNSLFSFWENSSAGSALITNNSGGTFYFRDSSNAGSATINNTGGDLNFVHGSNAGNATITNSNLLIFRDVSSANSAIITNNRLVAFWGISSAGSTAITSAATVELNESSSLGSATITNAGNGTSGGILDFRGASTANNATVKSESGSNVDISMHTVYRSAASAAREA